MQCYNNEIQQVFGQIPTARISSITWLKHEVIPKYIIAIFTTSVLLNDMLHLKLIWCLLERF